MKGKMSGSEKGWLQKQIEANEERVKSWPDWLKKATGIKGPHNVGNVCSDFMEQCEAFADKLVVEAGISPQNAKWVKSEIVRHLSYSITAIEHSLLNEEKIPKYEEIPHLKNPYRPGPMIIKPDFRK